MNEWTSSFIGTILSIQQEAFPQFCIIWVMHGEGQDTTLIDANHIQFFLFFPHRFLFCNEIKSSSLVK